MNWPTPALIAILLLAAFGAGAGAVFTRLKSASIEARFPPVGSMITVNGRALHVADLGPRDAPAVLFIHGASGNLRDPLLALTDDPAGDLTTRYHIVLADRPGHGWSERGPDDATPAGQARTLAALLDALGIQKAIIVGHSFGAAVATSLALEAPGKVAGLVLLAPVSHPWPGGRTNWYSDLAVTPVIGSLFNAVLALPAGLARIERATRCVFSPNAMPDDYLDRAGIDLVLTPRRFRANAEDITGLLAHVRAAAPRYGTIAAPTVVITGDRDTVVFEEIHAAGLARDIPGARLLWIANLGHKPDYVVPDLVAAAIDEVSGIPRDLDTLARAAEARLAGDAFGPAEACPEPEIPSQ